MPPYAAGPPQGAAAGARQRVLAAFLVACVLWGAGFAQDAYAQVGDSIKLISNTAQSGTGTHFKLGESNRIGAGQGFTTGDDGGGYLVDYATIYIRDTHDVGNIDLEAAIRTAHTNGNPTSTRLITLIRNRDPSENTHNHFEAPANSAVLKPDTRYFLMLWCLNDSCGVPGNDNEIQLTTTNTDMKDDDSEADWGILHLSHRRHGSSWQTHDNNFRIRVFGWKANRPYIVDDGVQIISTPTATADGDTYGLSDRIEFEVTFNKTVYVVSGEDPGFKFRIAGSDRTASFNGGAGTSKLRFIYTVAAGDTDSNGISVRDGSHSLVDEEGNITDSEGDAALLEHDSLGTDLSGHKINASITRPTITTLQADSSPLVDTTYGLGETIRVAVVFDTAVAVTGTPKLALQIGSNTREVSYTSGAPGTILNFDYEVVAGDADGNGISIPANALATDGDRYLGPLGGGTIVKDSGGRPNARLVSDAVSNDAGRKVNGTLNRFAATGKPTIAGVAKAGRTLSAEKGTIADRNGTTKADNADAGYAYTYQWVRVVGGTDTDISGATSKTYMPVTADVGKPLKVEVSFKDDADNPEGPLTSTETSAVTALVAPTTIVRGWSLTPSGLAVGTRFRLLFLSSTKRNASPTAISNYNTFVQNRAAAGHASIRAYSAGFRVVGCTAAVDAIDNTDSAHAPADKGVPIYWLNGNKVVDDYEDFYDGDWDDEANDKNESGANGPDTSQNVNYPFTGCANDGTEDIVGGISYALGSDNTVTVGRPNETLGPNNPISSNSTTVKTSTRPMYGLSEVFEVPPLSNDASLSALVVKDGTTTLALSPTFSATTTDYMVRVGNSVDEVTIIPTGNISNPTVEIQDSGGAALTDADTVAADFQVALDVGANTFRVAVTAEDGNVTETYTVVVTRTVAVTIRNASRYEGNEFIRFTISHDATSGGTPDDFTLELSTSDGTATAGADYTAVSAEAVQFNVGDISKTFTVTVNDDDVVEADETFTVTVTVASGHAEIADGTATGTIFNDEPVEAPENWSLTPSGLAAGAEFRLLFLSSTKRNANASSISIYNTFVQNRAAGGHADIQAYSAGFRAVGCTTAVDARDNTRTTYTTADRGVPIYWLNGTKVVDNYRDFYDGAWDDEANDKDESGNDGPDSSQVENYPFTGCDDDGTEEIHLSDSRALGVSGIVAVGRLNSGIEGDGPLNSNHGTGNGSSQPFYGLSEVFLSGGGISLSTDATLSDLVLKEGSTVLDLDPTFATSTTAYTASVANDVDEVTIVPTVNQSGAMYEIQDSDGTALTDADTVAADFQVDLDAGANTIKVEVTAEDGIATETYTVVVLTLDADAQILVSNLEQPAEIFNSASTRAQTFTTGSNSDGYTLDDIQVLYADEEGDAFSVAVYTVTTEGLPDTRLYALTRPDTFAATSTVSTLTFTAPVGSTLAASTTYSAVLNFAGASIATGQTSSDNDAEDSGSLSDWSIGDVYHFIHHVDGWTESSSNKSALIRVNGTLGGAATVPGVPFGFTVRANGETEIKLSWAAPEDDGGADVTGYRVEVSTNGGASWSDLVADTERLYTGYDHTGLTAGESRAYRVSAINSEGTGPPSGTRGVTTAAANMLVSNTGRNSDPGVSLQTGDVNLTRSQGFRTGTNPAGYDLASVGVYINDEDLEPGETFTVHIYTDNGSGGLGTLVHTLTSPTSYTNNAVNEFTAPADATLAASTDYHVVFEGTGDSPTDMKIGFTPANAEDIGRRTGWQIENARRLSGALDVSGSNYLISVNGTATPTDVASTWGLVPTGLGIGDTFRLLFLSSTKRNTLNIGISFYNTHVQDAAAAGHTDIQSYSAGFRVVGCSIAVDGRNNTRMIFTESDKGVPIYWLNGAKVADDYEDFYDGDWDEEENDKDESGADGPDTSVTANYPWTGCAQDGKEYFDSGNSTHALDSGSGSRVGVPNSSATNEGPIDGNNSFISSQLRPLYGLSEIFRVATSTEPIMGTNNAATGTPAITGTAKVGSTLLATTNMIADDDGTTKADNDDAGYAYTFQWVRTVSGTETDIAGATSDRYDPVLADVGSTLKVKVRFKDDAGNPEGPLVSAVTAAVQDTPPVVSIAGEMRLEGSGSVQFVISQDRPGGTDRPFTVSLSTSDGTATAGDDYVAANSQSVFFSVGDSSKARTVFLYNDDIDEANETFTVTITVASGTATIGTGTATGTILDDDEAGLSLSKMGLTVLEEDATGNTYDVALTSEPTAGVVVTVTGTSGTDVTATPGVLNFATSTWATAQTVTVTAADDADTDNDAALLVHVGASADPNYVGVLGGSFAVTVTDNDTPNVAATGVPTITGTAKVGQALSATTGAIVDTNGTTKAEAREAGYAFTYQWVRTANGTDTDIPGAIWDVYTPTFDDVGATLKVKVSFKDDADNPEGPLVSAVTAAVIDDPPVVSIADETRLEGDGAVTFTISLDGSGGSDRLFTVSASTSDGTATAGDDYVELASQTVQFGFGDTTRTINVNVNDDAIAEADETFTVTITVASGAATIGTGTATGTILDDDSPAVRLTPDRLTVVEAQSAVYRAVLQTLPTDDVTVTITGVLGDLSIDKTALDFTPSNWSNPQTVTVTAADDSDNVQDADVTLMHLASGASEYQGLSAALVVSIQENDPSLVFSKTALSVPEGGTADYTVALATVPSADVMVTISGVSGDLSLDRTSLEFTPANWDVPQTVIVAAAEDSDASTDPAVTLTHTASGGDYNAIVGELRVTVTENDSSGGGGGGSGGGSGGGGGSANRPPVIESEIEDQMLDAGESLELDIRLNFYDRDQRALDYSVESDDPSVAEVEVDRNGLVTIHGIGRGVTGITVTAADRREESVSQTLVVTVGGPALVALVPRAADLMREGFVRVINHAGESGEIAIEAIDDTGMRAGPVALTLNAGETVHFNSNDLEDGNAAKGLADGVGPGEGDWRLVLDSDLDFEVLSYIRTEDGFLTAIHDIVPLIDGAYRVAIFNPGDNPNQVSHLRLINPGDGPAEVTIEGIDDAGDSPGDAVTFDVPAGESATLTASELESGTGLDGTLGDGVGKWRLSVTSDQPLVAMSLLSSPTGHLTNLSTMPRTPDEDGAYVVPLFPAASDPLGRQGFARVVNRSDESGTVLIEAYDDSDFSYPAVTLALDAGQTQHFNSDDLELGNADKGLTGSTGTGVGDWRLVLSSDLELDVLAYIRTDDGFLTSMHDIAPALLGERRVAIFNPGDNPNQVSRLRLVNPGTADAQVTITGIDDAGASPGQSVTVTVPAGASRTIAAADLEAGGEGFAGAFGDGAGKWRLAVISAQPIIVMSLLSSPTGHLTNLSTAPDRGGL